MLQITLVSPGTCIGFKPFCGLHYIPFVVYTYIHGLYKSADICIAYMGGIHVVK